MVPIYVKPPNDLSKARLLNGKDRYRNIITNHKLIIINFVGQRGRGESIHKSNADPLPLESINR